MALPLINSCNNSQPSTALGCVNSEVVMGFYNRLHNLGTSINPHVVSQTSTHEGASYKFAKEGVGALSSVSIFNHERVPVSCLE